MTDASVSANSESVNLGADDLNLSMKPLLGLAIQEAVKLALIDSVFVPTPDGERVPTDDERRAWSWDIHSMPDECMARMDPTALGQNVAVRLLGSGGWHSSGVYSGNATPREILDSCIYRPDEDPLGSIKMALGLKDEPDE